jgi:Tol biopolymer transport system component
MTGSGAIHLGSPDPAGEKLSIVDSVTGDLALRDLASGDMTRLTSNKSPEEFAYFSSFARSGQQVAYAWFNHERYYDLRTVDLITRKSRILHRNEERRFVQPCAWTPGDREILTLFFRNDNVSQIALVDSVSGAVKVLRSLDWVYPNRMDVSNDGRWIVYDDIAREGSPQRDIFLLSSDGSSLRRAVEHEAHDVFPLFAPDGRSLLFLSNRSGTNDLWRQPLDGGPPERLKADMGRALALGVARNGSYFFARRSGLAEIWVGEPDSPRPLLARSPDDAAQPAWSADGKQLAFLAKAGQENFGQDARVVVIANVETGAHRVISPHLVHMDRLEWHPSGIILLVGGGDRHGQRGLYLVDTRSGETKPFVRERAAAYQGFEGVYTPGGETVYYLQAGQLRTKTSVLYTSEAALAHLAVSRDGNWLAFCEQGDGSVAVKAISSKGGAARQLASVRKGNISGLDWLPDGSGLIASIPSEPPAAWRIPLEEGKPERLPWKLNQQGPIRFHPNGKWIAYSSGKPQTEICVLDRIVDPAPAER